VAVFWRSLFGALFLLPICLFLEWPTDLKFYIFIVSAALMACIGDIFMFQALKKHGGAVISRMMGFRPIALFLVWPFYQFDALDKLIQAPLIGIGVILCLIITAVTFVFTKRNALSYAAFLAFLPSLALFTFCDIYQKLGAEKGGSLESMIILTFLTCVIMTTVSGCYMMLKSKKIGKPETQFWISGLTNGGVFIALVFMKSWGLSLSASPAYFNALSLLFVFWTFLVHVFLFKKKDLASPLSGFIIVISAAILTVLVEMLPK
jgi:hypothetical protein